jgi:outer membrane protein TolC
LIPVDFQIRNFVFFLGVVLAMSSSLRARAAVLSLQTALARLEANSPELQKLSTQQKILEIEATSLRSSILPQLRLETSHGPFGEDPKVTDGSIWSQSSLLASSTFYDNGQTSSKKKIQALQSEINRLRLTSTRNRIYRDLLVAWLDYSVLQIKLKIQREFNALLDRQSTLAQRKYRQGVALRRDALQFQGELQRGQLVEQDLANQEQLVLIQIRGLLRMNVEEATDLEPIANPQDYFVTPHEFELAHSSQSQSLDDLGNELSEAHLYHLQTELTDAQLQLTRAQTGPDLELVGRAQYGSSQYIGTDHSWSDNAQNRWSVLLNFNWTFWDWGERDRKVETTRLEQSQLSLTQLQQARSQQDTLGVKLQTLTYLQSRESISRLLLRSETESKTVLQNEYRNGRVSYQDYVLSLANWNSARITDQDIRYDKAKNSIELRAELAADLAKGITP